MSKLFNRWRTEGAPPALRWWIPSPSHLSHALQRGQETSWVVTKFAAVNAVLTGVLLALPLAFLGRAAMADARGQREAYTMATGMFALDTILLLPTAVFAFLLPRTRPQVSRTLLALSVFATLTWSLGDTDAAAAATVAALVGAIALLALPSSQVLPVFRRAGVALLVVSSAAALALPVVALAASRYAAATWGAVGMGPLTAWGMGVVALVLGAVMLAVQQAERVFWSAPESWRQAELMEGNLLRFEGGGAPRQAPDAFGGYTGPVVVIPASGSTRSVFRSDGAPDDGWTVPGTIDTLREAVARSEHAALASALTPLACAASLLLSGLLGALKIFS